MDYFFNSHLRWNLGWDTPNQGGAFLVTLLPWVWVLTTWLVGRAIILGPGLGRIEDLGPSQSGALGTKRTTSADESGPASARPATARIVRDNSDGVRPFLVSLSPKEPALSATMCQGFCPPISASAGPHQGPRRRFGPPARINFFPSTAVSADQRRLAGKLPGQLCANLGMV